MRVGFEMGAVSWAKTDLGRKGTKMSTLVRAGSQTPSVISEELGKLGREAGLCSIARAAKGSIYS